MASKRKFKRDYIILESKDTNFRYKERILPKAFAKVEINDEKSIVSLYVENLKYVKDGYRVVLIQSDYDTLELERIVLSEQGKGEFVLNLPKDDIEIKGIALLYEKSVPLIGFKGSKIENYEEILFTGDDEYEEVEYIEVEDDEEYEEYEEYEEIEYIEIEDDEEINEYTEVDDNDEYEEIDDGYIEIDEEYKREDKNDYEDEDEDEDEYENDYDEYNNVEETIDRNLYKSKHQPSKSKQTQDKSKTASYSKQPRHQQTDHKSYEKPDPKNQNTRTAGTLLMPRQIKKGLKYFDETKPFVSDDIEDTRWWKIDISPTTLCGYTMPNLGYVNTLNYTMYSDIVMHSYKYRHYLFGVQYDAYNKRQNYIYAIPGNKNEQPDQGHTGFNTYKACDNRNSNLGYWLCFIDSRSRRILK